MVFRLVVTFVDDTEKVLEGDIRTRAEAEKQAERLKRTSRKTVKDVRVEEVTTEIPTPDEAQERVIPDIRRPALRSFQVTSIAKFLTVRKGTIILPTGLGKTLLALEILRRTGENTAVLVPTEILVQQWFNELIKAGFPFVGRFFADRKEVRPITVFTYASALRNIDIVRRFDSLVFDEVQEASAPLTRKLLELVRFSKFALGLTATLNSEEVRKTIISRFLPIIFELTFAQAKARQFVPPIQIIPIDATFTSDERQRHNALEKTISDAAFELMRGLGTTDPFTANERLSRITDPEKRNKLRDRLNLFLTGLTARRQLLSSVEDKKDKLLRIARDLEPKEAKILGFSESVPAVVDGCRFLRQNDVLCQVISGDTPPLERQRLLREWGKTFRVLLSVRVLERGFNVPDAGVGIFLASGSRERQIIQRIGRLIRPLPGKVVRLYILRVRGTKDDAVVEAVEKVVKAEF